MQTNFHPDEPESHGNGKRKRKKPYAIEWRHPCFKPWLDWRTYKRYESEEDRDKALQNLIEKPDKFEYRKKD